MAGSTSRRAQPSSASRSMARDSASGWSPPVRARPSSWRPREPRGGRSDDARARRLAVALGAATAFDASLFCKRRQAIALGPTSRATASATKEWWSAAGRADRRHCSLARQRGATGRDAAALVLAAVRRRVAKHRPVHWAGHRLLLDTEEA